MATMLHAAEDTQTVSVLRSYESKRFKVKFESEAAMNAALAAETVGPGLAVIHPARAVLSVEMEAASATYFAESFSTIQNFYGARIVEDYRYEMEDLDFFNPAAFSPDDIANPSLDDVIEQIRASSAWTQSRGSGVILAIVDTGIEGARPEFSAARRLPGWAPIGEQPWTDWQGHGTMCASIAAGSKADGGVFDGVAPEATVMACRTHFYDTELAAIYDALTALAKEGHKVVASNSFGLKRGTPPSVPEDSDFIPALEDAIAAGVHVFFSAGNYHHLAGGTADGHEPTSIWLHKCRADLMTVGASKPDGTMWYYSSRGPGQHHGDPNTNAKPDVVGVTPPFGRVVYGDQVRVLDEGWGTSGCCPQAAGLAALMLSKTPGMSRQRLFDILRETSVDLGLHPYSQGQGRIDCDAAVSAA